MWHVWVPFSMNFVDWLVGLLVGCVELHFCVCEKLLLSGDVGYMVVQLVEALRYKPEDRGINSRWCH